MYMRYMVQHRRNPTHLDLLQVISKCMVSLLLIMIADSEIMELGLV